MLTGEGEDGWVEPDRMTAWKKGCNPFGAAIRADWGGMGEGKSVDRGD